MASKPEKSCFIAGRRITFTEPERTDLPRQTFYIESAAMRRLKIYAAIDARGVSEIVREALDRWLDARDAKGIAFEHD